VPLKVRGPSRANLAERRRLAEKYTELLLAQGPTAEQREEHIRRMYELHTPIGPEVCYNLMFSMPTADVLHISACCQYASTQMLQTTHPRLQLSLCKQCSAHARLAVDR